jgi:hypothetical protein
MYMPGRLRTASRPSRTVIDAPLYSFLRGLAAELAGLAAAAVTEEVPSGSESGHFRHERGADEHANRDAATPGNVAVELSVSLRVVLHLSASSLPESGDGTASQRA